MIPLGVLIRSIYRSTNFNSLTGFRYRENAFFKKRGDSILNPLLELGWRTKSVENVAKFHGRSSQTWNIFSSHFENYLVQKSSVRNYLLKQTILKYSILKYLEIRSTSFLFFPQLFSHQKNNLSSRCGEENRSNLNYTSKRNPAGDTR